MELVEVYISRILDSGSGFLARSDNGDQAFIPSSVVKASGIREGDIVYAKLIPNSHPNNAGAPWVAINIKRRLKGGPEIDQSGEELEEAAYRAVVDMVIGTSAEIADDIGATVESAERALVRLFRSGRVAKAEVYDPANRGRVTYCIWALGSNDFLGEFASD